MVVLQRSFPRFQLHPRQYELDNKSPSFVQFSIHSNSRHKSIWLRSRSEREVVDEIEYPITGRVAKALQSPLTHDDSFPIIDHMLATLPIDSTQRDCFIAAIIFDAAKIVNADDRKLWVVAVEIEIITEFCVEELNDDEGGRDSSGMVPANGSSIAADLEEEVKVNNSSGDLCVICLEEFPMGSDSLARMPCSHVFHSNCIIKWLNTSHHCPLCRFQMPT